MAHKIAKYPDVRDKMQPGDIIAFSGKGHFSEIIKWATRSGVSHVGIILQTTMLIDRSPVEGRYFNQIVESTSLNGFSGVTINRLSDRVDMYEGEMWWLPLKKEVRAKMDFTKFYDFLLHQERKEYDMPQAVKSALDETDKIPLLGKATYNIEDFSRFFCSELAAAGLEAGKAIKSLNASEVTPADLCMFSIYDPDYYQIKGKKKVIKGHNSLDPEGWGE